MTDTKTPIEPLEATDVVDELLDMENLVELPEYQLRVSKDRVCVELDCPDPHSDVDSLITDILADFRRLEIPEYPDAAILKKILAAACKPGQYLREHVIMMGAKAIQPIDGKLEWGNDYFAEGWAIDDVSGNIDFWAKLEDRSVRTNELLVRLHLPVEGTPGLNVFGTEIPVTKPASVKMRSGKNVTTKEEGNYIAYYATCNGRIRLADGTVAVDDVYTISGNVSLETGNVIHTGAVMIQGDVGAGATIEAEGDIMVKGMLEPCHIKCGGCLTVAGGIVGDEDHRIDLAGDLMAKYITEAVIEVGGDVMVGNEISHSYISCLGHVKVPKGRIAGGSTLAKLGIRVGEAGSSGASDTKLIAGVDHTLERKIRWHDEKILKLEEAQEILQSAIKLKQRNQNMTAKDIKSLNGLKRQNNHLAQAMADEHMNIQKLKIEAENSCVKEIIIFKELWSGTKITLGHVKTVIKRSILKPRMVHLKGKDITVLPLGEGNMPED